MALTMADGFDVRAAVGSGEDAVAAVVRHEAELAVLDLRMPGLDGIGAAKAIREQRPQATLVLLTGSLEEALPDDARVLVDSVLPKTLRVQTIAARLAALGGT